MHRSSQPLRSHVSMRGRLPGNAWRCAGCGALLGRRIGERMLIRLSRGHQYALSGPATAVCRGCKTLNETP